MRRQEDARPDAVNVETGHELDAGAQDQDIASRARRHDYAVRVVAERRDGVVTTSFYTNLPAAERKVLRTRERGLRADLVLVRVVPVGMTPEPLVPSVEALADLLAEAGGRR